MKNVVLTGYALVAIAIVAAAAHAYTSPAILLERFSPSSGIEMKELTRQSLENVKDAVDSVVVGSFTVDTNAVVDTTAYTPFAAGALLYGSESNKLFVAVDATTNGWKEVSMEAL